MKRQGEDAESGELGALVAAEKRAALAVFDSEAFARRVRRAVVPSAEPARVLGAWWTRPALIGAFALLVLASAATWWSLSRAPQPGSSAVVAALRSTDFYAGRTPLPVSPAAAEGPGSDLEWALRALVHRARRTSTSRPAGEGEVATALAEALTGSRAAGHAFEPGDVSSDDIARRLAALSRDGALVRALARAN